MECRRYLYLLLEVPSSTFHHCSFAWTSTQNLSWYLFFVMEDGDISPIPSRDATPNGEDETNHSATRYPATYNSITDLSQHFDRHTLAPRRPTTIRETLTTRARDHAQNLQSASNFSNRVCRQRRSLNRLQCSPTHLSRISALVENVVQTGHPIYDSTHPNSSILDDSTSPSLSPDERQPSQESSYFGFTPLSPTSTSAFGTGNMPSLRHVPSYKIDKELRHCTSRETIGGQRMVQKKVRMRRSSKSLAKTAGKGRERG